MKKTLSERISLSLVVALMVSLFFGTAHTGKNIGRISYKEGLDVYEDYFGIPFTIITKRYYVFDDYITSSEFFDLNALLLNWWILSAIIFIIVTFAGIVFLSVTPKDKLSNHYRR